MSNHRGSSTLLHPMHMHVHQTDTPHSSQQLPGIQQQARDCVSIPAPTPAQLQQAQHLFLLDCRWLEVTHHCHDAQGWQQQFLRRAPPTQLHAQRYCMCESCSSSCERCMPPMASPRLQHSRRTCTTAAEARWVYLAAQHCTFPYIPQPFSRSGLQPQLLPRSMGRLSAASPMGSPVRRA